MNFVFEPKINIDIKSSALNDISSGFFTIVQTLLPLFFQMVITKFAEYQIKNNLTSCSKCGSNDLIWKTKHGKKTSLITIFGNLFLNQLQVQCKCCGKKFYITRKLLDIPPRIKIPLQTIKKLGLIGALTTFRVAQKIVSIFGWNLDKMTIWRSVQKLAKTINFDLSPSDKNEGEADGTGIPIRGIRKRGMELKVFVQHKLNGGIRIAGLSIGKYDGGWDKLFSPLTDSFKKFKNFFLRTDGDTSILKSIKTKIKIIYQRCLWHIPHQFKYTLWQDKVSRKSTDWINLFSKIIDICNVKGLIDKDEDIINEIVDNKRKQIDDIILTCKQNGWMHCASYLKNAKPDLFTGILNKLSGTTTSLVERVMRTVNMRINVGKWSPSGALNVNKVRLAYYYNEFDI